MNKEEKLLIDLLKSAIRDKAPQNISTENISWDAVYKLAADHNVYAIIYPQLAKLTSVQLPDKRLITEWQYTALFGAAAEIRHISEISRVLNKFIERNIAVIVLKGLVIRELYPQPEFRIMSDSDLLVHEEDKDVVREVLLDLGYHEVDSCYKHLSFLNEDKQEIEIHFMLLYDLKSGSPSFFNEDMWRDTITVDINGIPSLALSIENQLIHICSHMAIHLLESGFGLRQLCDLVLFVEANYDRINWISLFLKLEMLGIQRFAKFIFIICSKLFDMKLPDLDFSYDSEDENNINLLISDLLASGVYGNGDMTRLLGGRVTKFKKYSDKGTESKASSLIHFLFPRANMLDGRFEYCQKYRLLLPIAWIHRLLYFVFIRKYSVASFTNSLTSALNMAEKRAALIRWLAIK